MKTAHRTYRPPPIKQYILQWRIKKWVKSLFEQVMAENFANVSREMNIQIQEAQRIQTRIKLKRPILRHNNLSKVTKNLESSNKKAKHHVQESFY